MARRAGQFVDPELRGRVEFVSKLARARRESFEASGETMAFPGISSRLVGAAVAEAGSSSGRVRSKRLSGGNRIADGVDHR